MQAQARDDLHLRPSSIRRSSFESDAATSTRRPSVITAFPPARPAPAYIAISAASQLATDNQKQRMHEELYDLSKTATIEEEGALFTEQALSVINNFLDHILYSFLATAPSASLPALRMAVEYILKGRLGRVAIAAANEELEELSVNGDDDELDPVADEPDEVMQNHVDLIFRRIRLRIMVYTRLGEMEEEEEESYLQDESLWEEDAAIDDAGHIMEIISPAATIFLTSVLEFVGEQCIELAAQAAFGRAALRRTGRTTPMFGSHNDSTGQRVVIEEPDVERIALNSTMGRLWRTWRKTMRTPKSPGFRSQTPISPLSRQLSARGSISTLRPQSAMDFYRHTPFVGGEPDMRSTLQHATTPKPGMNGVVQSRQPIAGSSSEEEANGGRKRIHPSPPSSAATADRYGYLTPAASSHGSHIHQSSDDMTWNEKRGGGVFAEFAEQHRKNGNEPLAPTKSKPEGDVTVPVSGVLHLHLPSNDTPTNLGANTVSESTVARFDFASPKTITYDQPDGALTPAASAQELSGTTNMMTSQLSQPPEESRIHSKVANTRTAADSGGLWNKNLVNQNAVRSASPLPPLKVYVPGSEAYKPTVSLEPSAFANGTKPDVSKVQGFPPKVVKVVTAKEITPTSETFSSPMTDRHFSTATFEPFTPRLGTTEEPTSPQISPRPATINPPPDVVGLSPREPRIQTESTRDFADFIRSTAPNKEQAKVAPLVGPTSPVSSKSPIKATSPTASSRSQSARGFYTSNSMGEGLLGTRYPSQYTLDAMVDSDEGLLGPVTPIMTRVKNPALEPRDPVIRGRGNDDLIAFLREGPPGSGASKPTPRETMERRTADKITISTMPSRTSDLTLTSVSKNESVSSYSPLLPQSSVNTTRTEHPAYSSHKTGTGTSQLQPAPKTQKRTNDPYALPSDDDDEDVLTALPRKTRDEESLIDFLTNTSPIGPDVGSGLGLKENTMKGLTLRPISPAAFLGPISGRSPITMSPLVANPTSPTPMPHLGEFLSDKISMDSARPPDIPRYDFSGGENRNKLVKPRPESRNENRNQGVRGFLKKMTAA